MMGQGREEPLVTDSKAGPQILRLWRAFNRQQQLS